MALLPPSPIGQPPGNSFWNDWYEKLRTIVNTGAISIAFNNITGKPTTLAGYGITNGQTLLVDSAGLRAALSDETGTGLAVFNQTPTINAVNLTGGVSVGGTPGLTVVVTTAKLTSGGTNGSMTFTNGILTAQTPAT